MVASVDPLLEPLARIEPGDRLVALARTIQARDPGTEAALKDSAADWARFGETCLGQALYRHRSVFRNAAEAPAWSHLELSYFRNIVPADAIHDLVVRRQPAGTDLLRAEILLTTPAAFILPRAWRGSADSPGRQASLEYIDVDPIYLEEYRDIMRRYIGPAAAELVRANRIGTFRAMETAAVLYRDPGLTIDWNQIHLCEVDADGFDGFGQAFDAVLRELSPHGGFAGVFAGLDRIRAIRRWTFNDPVAEADSSVARQGATDG
ncbi:hypothetical protein DFR50_109132 [Roseiarcus fermentans]|uniref:EthD domain-containing protein n=1 Tax=Roseiarcus fermentans TaxID=1473586 RepID=A0A366FI95_9HYPH|nr:hypothetical protein [Roseiarcus fermentans]RBP14378.1 hypothetical protein DFR50_109132 [Roseiarcus fermentans]